MSVLKNKSIKFLLDGVDDYEASRKRINGGNLNSIKTLYEEFLKTDSKPQRDRLINEFKKKNQEFAEFIQSNPELIDTEIQKALLLAASGGEYSEEEITIDSRGGKKVKHIKKTALPDISAVRELRAMMGDSESADSSMAEAWIDALLGDEEDEL
ncbi:hypothetical protein [Porcipelethomonas sp.]|uniref:hypothetical protein n=1 Tax=Porcipelethomonas sp. TaxID=2981675 RepID=UPI003EF87936